MPRLRVIIFDLDDTLYPEREYVRSGFRAVAAWVEGRLGLRAGEAFDGLEALFGAGVRGDTFNRWLADRDVSDDGVVAEMVEVYRGHFPSITPYHGVPELLSRLRADHKLGLLSDGDGGVQRRKLEVLGLVDAFDTVLFSDTLGRGSRKPSPRPYEAVLVALGVTGPESVYVSDNPTKDFLGARLAGLSSIRLRMPGGIYAGLEPESPDHAPDLERSNLVGLEEALRSFYVTSGAGL